MSFIKKIKSNGPPFGLLIIWAVVFLFFSAVNVDILASTGAPSQTEKAKSSKEASESLRGPASLPKSFEPKSSKLKKPSTSLGAGLSLSKPNRLALSTDTSRMSNANEKESLAHFVEPGQPIVLLHTDNGFVPSDVALQPRVSYKVHVANVSQQHRVASFYLQELSLQRSMPFGDLVEFTFSSRVPGEFFLVSPESGALVRFWVLPDAR